jgi:hypothetical protein
MNTLQNKWEQGQSEHRLCAKYSVTQLSHVKFMSRTNLCLQVLIGWFYTVISH